VSPVGEAGCPMKERPILFSAPMVQAILAGRKTQTRRLVKPQPRWHEGPVKGMGSRFWEFGWATVFESGHVHTWDDDGIGGENWDANRFPDEDRYTQALLRSPRTKKCPYGQVGDRLWVRETFWQEVCLPSGAPESEYDEYEEADYVATPECLDPPTPKFSQTVEEWTGEVVPGEWWLAPPNDWDGESAEDLEQRGQWVFLPWSAKKVPSIHMPRWASRITLEITGVRVERLQDIRPSDIPCEGVTFGGLSTPDSLTKDFEILWDGINAERGFGWAANPWVWVIEFKRVTPC
jgi:hypothetical protein